MDQVEKVKIKLLRNARGSEDGFTVRHFEKDEEATVSKDLAKALIANGDAEKVSGEKSVQTAPANKAVQTAPANKGQ